MYITRISASKSDIIDQCGWKYYLKYVEKLDEGLQSPNEDSLNFGSFIHKVFELGYKEKTSKDLLKLAESERATYKIPFRDNSRIQSCIEHFIMFNQKLGETVSTEWKFEIKLDEKNDITFNGVIDRIIRGTSGGYLVIDYKTSKREKKKKDLLTDKQLMGYAYAIHKTYNVPYKDIVCAHYYPLTNNFVEVRFTEFQIKGWMKKEIDKVWRIRKKKKGEFYPTENMFCDWCEFKCSYCPKFSQPQLVEQRLDEYRQKKKDQSKSDKDPEIIG